MTLIVDLTKAAALRPIDEEEQGYALLEEHVWFSEGRKISFLSPWAAKCAEQIGSLCVF